jgi:hypothetical protein
MKNLKSEMKKNNNTVKTQTGFVIYETDDKAAKVNVRLEKETVWLTQAQLADLFLTSRPNITMHIKNILEEDELQEVSVCKDFLHTAADGKNYTVTFYSLDMILAVGFRIRSKRGVQFMRWANTAELEAKGRNDLIMMQTRLATLK